MIVVDFFLIHNKAYVLLYDLKYKSSMLALGVFQPHVEDWSVWF